MLERDEPGENTWSPFSAYLLSTDGVLLVMTCSLSDSHPADDWRAIAETIEFLPPEE